MSLFTRRKNEEWPSYALTDRLPATEGDRLLGRIVVDYKSPTDGYKPYDPRPALAALPGVLEIIDTEFSSLFSIEKNSQVKAKLATILHTDFDKLEKEENSLKSSFVRTRWLQQHRDAFDALVAHHSSEILQLLENKKGYMVVGYKSCVNGQMGRAREYSTATKVDLNIPTGAAVTAMSHGTINLGDQADVGGGTDSGQKQNTNTTATMVGEQIFAVRYRIVEVKKGKKEDVQKDFGDVHRVSYANGVYGLAHDNMIEEDDDPDDENEEQDYWLVVHSEDVLDMDNVLKSESEQNL